MICYDAGVLKRYVITVYSVALTFHLFIVIAHRTNGAGMTKNNITPMPMRKNGRKLAAVQD